MAGRRGSVRQEPNGTWSFTVDVGKPGERRQSRRRGFASKRAAQAALTSTLRALDVGEFIEPSRLTFREYVEETWLPLARTRLRRSTLHSYERNLRQHVFPALGGTRLQQVNATQLNRLYGALLADGLIDRSKARGHRRGLSVRTVRYIHTIVRAVLKSATKADLISRNPADFADPPRASAAAQGSTSLRTWTATELAAFLASQRDTREYPLWLLLATTGMRRGEALGLAWSSVNLETGLLTITRTLVDIEDADDDAPVWSDPKTQAGRRSVALDDTTVAALRRHRRLRAAETLKNGEDDPGHDLVFAQPNGRPYHPERITRTFQARALAAGLPVIRLHDLRHTWATLALAAGIPAKIVQDRLGHSTVAITLNIYSHVTPPMQRDAAAKVAAVIFNSSPTR